MHHFGTCLTTGWVLSSKQDSLSKAGYYNRRPILANISNAPLLNVYILQNLNIKVLSRYHYRLFKLLNCPCKKNCNRVTNYSIITVFVEKRWTRVRYVSQMCFSPGLDSIDSVFYTDCKKDIKP